MSDIRCTDCGGLTDDFYCFDCYTRLEEEKEDLEQKIESLEAIIIKLESELRE